MTSSPRGAVVPAGAAPDGPVLPVGAAPAPPLPCSRPWGLVMLALLLALLILPPPALATRLPGELQKSASIAVGGKPRLDGSMQAGQELYLLLVPSKQKPDKKKDDAQKVSVDLMVPAGARHPDLVFYTNGFAHVRVSRRGQVSTLALPRDLNDKTRKRLLGMHFPSDLIVPQGFVLPRSLKPLATEVPAVLLVDDEVFYNPEFGQKQKHVAQSEYKGSGSVFLTSITSGSITLLDGKTFNKIAEFPTEGTPCSMELANGQLYIADEAKHRLLVIDPIKRTFCGQIDLPPRSAPKGIAAMPSGKILYVSESGASDIAVIETATGKVLMRTKVPPGPARMALTPDGNFLLVLNVTSGAVTIISTYNQRVITAVRVGYMPTALAISSDGKFAYVSNRNSDSVSVIDIPKHAVVGTIKCGQSPNGIALSADNKHLYVAAARDNTITEYDTASLSKLRELHLPTDIDFPGSLCILPDHHHFLVTSQGTDSLAVVDTDKLEIDQKMALGHANHEAVWEPVP